MNLNVFSSAEMASVTASWTGPQKAIFASIPKVAIYLADIEEIHALLLQFLSSLDKSQAIKQLTEVLAQTDEQHDLAVRAVHETMSGTITFLRLLGDQQAEAQRVQALLDWMLPMGLRLINYAFRDEAGVAEALANALAQDSEKREALRQLPVAHGTVLDATLKWCELGQRLGQLDAQRSVLQAAQPELPPERELRSTWIKVVKQVLGALELVKGQEEAVLTIRQPVLDASRQAVERQKRRAATAAASAAGTSSSAEAGSTASPEGQTSQTV